MTSNAREWNRRPMTFKDLAGVDLDLRLSAANVIIGSSRIGRTAIAANLRSGDLTLTIGESQAFGGLVTGSVAISKMDDGAELKSQMQFSNVDLEHCLRDLIGIRRIEGKGDLNFLVEGVGTTVDALTHTLNGTAPDGDRRRVYHLTWSSCCAARAPTCPGGRPAGEPRRSRLNIA
jgi:AsmA protein